MMNSSNQDVAQIQKTAHMTAVIGTIGVCSCLFVAMLALAIVVARDGSVQEVSDALHVLASIGEGLAVTLGVLVAGPQAVSAILSTLIGRLLPATSPKPATPPVGE